MLTFLKELYRSYFYGLIQSTIKVCRTQNLKTCNFSLSLSLSFNCVFVYVSADALEL